MRERGRRAWSSPAQEFVLAGIDSQGYRHYEFVE